MVHREQRSDEAVVIKQNFPHVVLEEQEVPQVHRATKRHFQQRTPVLPALKDGWQPEG